MKKNILIFMLFVFTFSFLNAQIGKPQKGTLIKKGLDVSKLKIKSLKDIKNLEIPVIDIPTNQYDLRPIRTWKITPAKKKDGNLRLYYFNGQQFENIWFVKKYYADLYAGTNDFVPNSIRRRVRGFYDNSYDSGGGLIAPLILMFNATPNIVYRVRFKVENTQTHNKKIAVVIGTNISYTNMNNHNEFVFDFIREEAGEFKIALGLFGSDGLEYRWQIFLKVSKIKIDQISR